jgi:hydrogenase maturation factor
MNEYSGLIKVDVELILKPGDYIVVDNGLAIDVILKEEFLKRQRHISEATGILDKLVEKTRNDWMDKK